MVAALAVPVAGALGVSTTVASVGLSLAAYTATTAASYFLQQSMVEKPSQEIGTKLQAVLGGAVNQAIHIGWKETAGSFLYENSWGVAGRVPNAYLVRVYCLSDRPVGGFENYVWAGGRKCNFNLGITDTVGGLNLGHPITAFNSGGGHRLWVKFHDGNQNTADDYLVAKFGSDPARPWTADFVGRGRAYMIVTQKYDKKQPAGKIDVVAVVTDSPLYDWREDSTNGGSGSQRYSDQATHGENTGNPVVAIYNIMRGIYRGNEWIYGGQAWPARRFDNDTWTAAANKCDENVSIAAGGTQKRFRAGAEIDVSEEPWTVIERLLKACNGRIVETGGVFKIYAGGIGASVFSFTDDEIILSEELTGRLFPSRDDVANTVNGTYIEPDNAGEAKAYKPRTDQDYIDADGAVRPTTLDLEYVRDNRQAQRLANLALKDGRRFRTFVVALWTEARKLEPCDIVSWTSTRFGFSAKKFIVGDVTLREDGIVILNLREADASDADWSTADEDAYEVGVFPDSEPAPQVLAATVTASSVKDDADEPRRPAVRIQATLDDEFVDCRALLWRMRKSAAKPTILASGRSTSFFDPSSADYGDLTVTDNAFLPGRSVQVSWKIEPESDRDTDWSAWTAVTLLSNARLKISTDTAEYDIDVVDTPNMKNNSVVASESFSIKKGAGKWSEADNNKHQRTLLAASDTAMPNSSKSPVLVNWKLTAFATLKVTGGTKGYASTSMAIVLRHINSGTSQTIGKVSVGAGQKKAPKPRTLKGSVFFPSADGAEAKFELVAIHSKKSAGITTTGQYQLSGGINLTRWKR